MQITADQLNELHTFCEASDTPGAKLRLLGALMNLMAAAQDETTEVPDDALCALSQETRRMLVMGLTAALLQTVQQETK